MCTFSKKKKKKKNQNKKVSRTKGVSLHIKKIHKCPEARMKDLQRAEHVKNQSTRDRKKTANLHTQEIWDKNDTGLPTVNTLLQDHGALFQVWGNTVYNLDLITSQITVEE